MQVFVLCTVEIKHHNRVAFHKGHVYIATQKTGTPGTAPCSCMVELISDLESLETYPEAFFKSHFKVMCKERGEYEH
jgi:hypothetical protein